MFLLHKYHLVRSLTKIVFNFLSDGAKESPKVLLLYSYDCVAHEEVVKKFANYLKTPGMPSSFA